MLIQSVEISQINSSGEKIAELLHCCLFSPSCKTAIRVTVHTLELSPPDLCHRLCRVSLPRNLPDTPFSSAHSFSLRLYPLQSPFKSAHSPPDTVRLYRRRETEKLE